MGVHTYSEDSVSAVAPSRLYKALIGDSQNLIPKLLPQLVKSIALLEGDGGVGSIRLIAFQDGLPMKNVKTRIDAMDDEKMSYTYSLVEGDQLNEKIESISYEVEFAPGPEGGSIGKMKANYVTKGDEPPTEEEIKIGKQTSMSMYKVVEEYLQQNPDAYV
ncbi:Major allergen Pru ar 1 [Linum grandiflorum]